MTSAIIATAMFMCDEVIDIDDDIDDYSDCINHNILVVEQEVAVSKTLGQRVQEKHASMIRIRKGLTVDSGAAASVMPPGAAPHVPRSHPPDGSRYKTAGDTSSRNRGARSCRRRTAR